MAEFRLKAVSPKGKMIKSEFEADSKKKAENRVEKLARKNGFKVKSIDKKQTYQYKVKKGAKDPVTGEQEAYSKEEVEKALVKLGYKVIRINKKWFDFKLGVPQSEVVNFIRLSADLLHQQLSFDEILGLLHEDTTNERMRDVISTIRKDLKEGKEGDEVYSKHEDVFGEFACYMLSVASKSGNMAQVFESTAKFLERDAEFKSNLRRSLLMPAITVLATIGVVLFYVGYIFPATAEAFVEMGIELPPMTAATLEMSYWLQANWLLLTLSFVIPTAAAWYYFTQTPKGQLLKDKNIIKIPVIGDLMHKTSIEIFSRVFYTLYSGSGQNIEVIKVAAEACRNKYMEKQIKQVSIKMMLKEGAGLIEALKASGVFTDTAISRFKLGAESGALKQNAKQLAQYYETQTTYKMDTIVDMISLGVNIFIMIALIGITIVSAESALIQPSQPGM